MGKSVKYVCIKSTLEQDLQNEMNALNRLFVASKITESYWFHHQMAAIDKYKKECLKI